MLQATTQLGAQLSFVLSSDPVGVYSLLIFNHYGFSVTILLAFFFLFFSKLSFCLVDLASTAFYVGSVNSEVTPPSRALMFSLLSFFFFFFFSFFLLLLLLFSFLFPPLSFFFVFCFSFFLAFSSFFLHLFLSLFLLRLSFKLVAVLFRMVTAVCLLFVDSHGCRSLPCRQLLGEVLMVADVGVTTASLASVYATTTPVAVVVFGVVMCARNDVLHHPTTTSGSLFVHHVHD